MKTIKMLGWALAVILVAGAAVGWSVRSKNGQTTSYRTAEVTRGDLLITISATGTLEPEEVVDVGAQVSGQIMEFGKDASGKVVDYSSTVEAGKMLARIDDVIYQANVADAEAQLSAAQAGIQQAEADLAQLRAKLAQAERDWLRAQKLGPSEALSQANYDAYQSAYECAKANVDIGTAAIAQARATLTQKESTLAQARRNLGYCTINSPVSGVIIDRRVNVGQTVAASQSTPSLFLVAKDLRRMQIWASVNEADIGRIKAGQPVEFTVDAFPGETFHGEVGKVRLNASMTQNVVTYIVEIVADNGDGRLLPYLTADVKFEVDRSRNVLLVPNAALRWQPSANPIAPQAAQADAGHGGESGVVWVLDGTQVRPVAVRLGLSDGTTTAVESEGLVEGDRVVTGAESGSTARADAAASPRSGDASASGGTTNPFLPKMPTPPRNAMRGGPPPM